MFLFHGSRKINSHLRKICGLTLYIYLYWFKSSKGSGMVVFWLACPTLCLKVKVCEHRIKSKDDQQL